MKEIQEKLKKAMKNLQDIDFMNYNARKENQRKLNKAYQELDNLAKQRNEVEADLCEANNRINDLLDIVKQKEKLIDLMAQELIDQQIRAFKDNFDPFKYINKEQVKKYFEERCK